jgi:hypothetical protein
VAVAKLLPEKGRSKTPRNVEFSAERSYSGRASATGPRPAQAEHGASVWDTAHCVRAHSLAFLPRETTVFARIVVPMNTLAPQPLGAWAWRRPGAREESAEPKAAEGWAAEAEAAAG